MDLDDDELKATRKLNGADKYSEADEMFEKLGYKKTITEQSETFELGENIIKFWVWAMNVQVFTKNQILCVQELQAINKKCEELGWL